MKVKFINMGRTNPDAHPANIEDSNDDNIVIACRRWIPSGDIKGTVQILHGMAEHSKRYDEFALFLADRGYAVYAHDHRGHGISAEMSNSPIGYLGKGGAFIDMVNDSIFIGENIETAPLYIFSHSMGTIVARHYLANCSKSLSDKIRGVVFSGINAIPTFKEKAALLVSQIQTLFTGGAKPDYLLWKMQFGGYNSYFEKDKTFYQWLSREQEKVDEYDKDPFCGGAFTSSFFSSLIKASFKAVDKKMLSSIPKEKSYLFISGSSDAVGGFENGFRNNVELFKKMVGDRVKSIVYPEGRHEMLNEINRKEVYSDIAEWIESI